MSVNVIGYAGPPAHGTAGVEDVVVDANGVTWVCTVAGTPGTWTGSKATTGIWSPSDWGSTGGWKTARAAAGSRLINVGGFGDSIQQGFYSSNWATKSYWALLMAALQSAYGDGGSGLDSVRNTTGLTTGMAGDIVASGSGGNAVGGFDAFGGPNAFTLFPHVAASGVTLTFTNVRGTNVRIRNFPTAGAGTISYSIDSGAYTGTINSTLGGSGVALGVTNVAVAAGTHTVVLTMTAGQPIIADVTGQNATGIIGLNSSSFGRSSTDIPLAVSLSASASGTVGALSIQAPALDLFLLELGINDITAANTAITFAKNIALALDYAKAGNAQCDSVIIAAARGSVADTNELYPSYVREMRAVAEAYGAAFVDFWPLLKNSYTYGTSQNFWGDGTSDGLPGSNAVHPSDTGHAFMESVLYPLLVA